MATDAAGNSAITNFFVTNSTVQLVISPVSNEYLNEPSVAVSGTVTPGYTVLINGMGTTVDENGNWSTTNNAPVYGNGMATFDAAAYGPGGGPPVLASLAKERPAFIYTSEHTDAYHYEETAPLLDGYIWQKGETYKESWSTNGARTFSGYQFADVNYECGPAGASGWLKEDFYWFDFDETGATYAEDCGTSDFYIGAPVWNMAYARYVPAASHWGTSGGQNGVVHHFYANVRQSYPGKTYTRRSRTYLKLRTGGRAGMTRKNLFTLSGSGQEYGEGPRVWGDSWIDTRIDPLDPTKIRVLGENLGNDGRLYVVLPDNEDLPLNASFPARHYNLNIGATKHKLWIRANDIRLTPDGVVPEAKFCVGQKVLFTHEWDSTPLGIASTPGPQFDWVASAKHVNTNWYRTKYIGSPPDGMWVEYGSQMHANEPDLWRVASPHAWWISGGEKSVALNLTVHFDNGQSAKAEARGKFEMYRPEFLGIANVQSAQVVISRLLKKSFSSKKSCENPNDFGGRFFKTCLFQQPVRSNTTVLSVGQGTARLDDGSMHFDVQVRSARRGWVDIQQLINAWRRWDVALLGCWGQTTGNELWLDNQEVLNNGTKLHIGDNGADGPHYFDSPSVEGKHSKADTKDSLMAYVRFTPTATPNGFDTGDNIAITLGIIKWNWEGHSLNNNGVWQLVATNNFVSPPTAYPDDSFPYWLKVHRNDDLPIPMCCD